MTVFLAGRTALAYWRGGFAADARVRRCRSLDLDAAEGGAGAVRKAAESLGCAAAPVEALVFDPRDVRHADGLRCHLWSVAVPAGAFASAGRGVRVASPELVFLQMARELDVAQLVALGMELCGTFVGGAEASPGIPRVRDRPLTTAERLRAFLAQTSGAHGLARARRAAGHVIDGAASPMEAETYMLLCLPPLLGGYGLPRPELNRRIDLSGQAANTARRSFCVGDLCWPQRKVVVEYFGAVHAGAAEMRSDAGRRLALEACGYRVITATAAQLASYDQFELFAGEVARSLGGRLAARVKGATPQRVALRRALATWRQACAGARDVG